MFSIIYSKCAWGNVLAQRTGTSDIGRIREPVMFAKKFAAVLVIVAAAISVGGSPLPGLSLVRDEARSVVVSSSMSESTSLLLFGSGLWALALLRRVRRVDPSA